MLQKTNEIYHDSMYQFLIITVSAGGQPLLGAMTSESVLMHRSM